MFGFTSKSSLRKALSDSRICEQYAQRMERSAITERDEALLMLAHAQQDTGLSDLREERDEYRAALEKLEGLYREYCSTDIAALRNDLSEALASWNGACEALQRKNREVQRLNAELAEYRRARLSQAMNG